MGLFGFLFGSGSSDSDDSDRWSKSRTKSSDDKVQHDVYAGNKNEEKHEHAGIVIDKNTGKSETFWHGENVETKSNKP